MLTIEQIIEEAKKAREKAYAPYSNFKVGAVIECKDGKFFYGANVENASYGLTVCAERNALYNAFTCGVKNEDIKEIHVMSKKGVTPCFICRQALVDFCNSDTVIYVYDLEGLKNQYTVSDLCTHSFSKGDLE